MVAGLILGIISASLSWIPFVFVVAIIGLICSISGRKKAKAENRSTGMGTAGLVLNIIGLVFGAIGTICTIVAYAALEAYGSSLFSFPDLLDILF